jgi:hypothetical protein
VTNEAFWMIREHCLSLALGLLFIATMAGQTLKGYHVFNEAAREHGVAPTTITAYLASGHFYGSRR